MLETVQGFGYSVLGFPDAAKAHESILGGQVGLVLSDFYMPGKTG